MVGWFVLVTVFVSLLLKTINYLQLINTLYFGIMSKTLANDLVPLFEELKKIN